MGEGCFYCGIIVKILNTAHFGSCHAGTGRTEINGLAASLALGHCVYTYNCGNNIFLLSHDCFSFLI